MVYETCEIDAITRLEEMRKQAHACTKIEQLYSLEKFLVTGTLYNKVSQCIMCRGPNSERTMKKESQVFENQESSALIVLHDQQVGEEIYILQTFFFTGKSACANFIEMRW